MTRSIAPSLRARMACLLLLAAILGCAHERRGGASRADLSYSFQLQRGGAQLNELQQYVVLLDRADYSGLRVALESSQNSELLVLCQELVGEREFSGERESIRKVVMRIAEYRAHHRAHSATPDAKLEECIGSLVAEDRSR